MKFSTKRLSAFAALATASILVLSGCSNAPQSGGDTSSIVVDASFDLKTADPNRQYETTGSIVAKSLYETLLTFEGDDVTKPVDGLASYKVNDNNTVLTLTMKPGAKFSDGSDLTVDDAVFSLKRVQGLKGNPSFLLDGVTIEKTGDDTLTLTSKEPNPALPFILPNPALSVVNQKVVEENGGSADTKDAAEAFLNKTSAGSGPYVLESFDAAAQVVLKANPEYTGEKPAHDRIVLRNVEGPTQKLNVERASRRSRSISTRIRWPSSLVPT